ncbi:MULTISPECIES: UDP-2,3-diacylglucosamine diphosphatase [unclassified Psychrobacter]|uniref:UDP-2,3-diacylglucosamine diphosphatase n=1 Tax=unclassified Psychrobacter TaxID=196806 RepID=UPI0025B427AA|nr:MULTISPECIES: UDP-2,3-diacylglucosamine diphosphatase [unclassified Psychrobacter]MDN3453468.1 UDP-2,3-diacylglucosamine diphosphatase [Psychrobacter sp. APC 3350]MDN3501959.1 UDP-2,3-diacylglucosamine diphosphatase [Psychrobacter sp. 5A.1]
MQTFNHLITTRPHEVRQVLISDLHLSPEEPALVQAFLALLDDCFALPALKRLFILGDWFEVWLGDDVYLSLSEDERQTHWLTPLIVKLKALRVAGCEILVMHGNRDFLLDQPFCNLFGGELIYEPYTLNVGQQNYRLEHGDALCTDDKKYQFFRKIMRNRLTQWYLLNKSLEKRLAIADNMRQKSQRNNANKATHIMDVNADAVSTVMADSDALLHGHTHRPDIHQTANDKMRYVLGDWRLLDTETRQPKVSAVIGAVIDDEQSNDSFSSNNTEFGLFEFKVLV